MGRAPCCDKASVKKGPWSPEEDATLKSYIEEHGTGGNWIALPQKIGLKRCGKSCRLRWLNYLRPNIKHGGFSEEEDRLICSLYLSIGSRWSIIAAQLPGRTDNDIKNYWNTRLKKKLLGKQRKDNELRKPKPKLVAVDGNVISTFNNQPMFPLWSSLPPYVQHTIDPISSTPLTSFNVEDHSVSMRKVTDGCDPSLYYTHSVNLHPPFPNTTDPQISNQLMMEMMKTEYNLDNYNMGSSSSSTPGVPTATFPAELEELMSSNPFTHQINGLDLVTWEGTMINNSGSGSDQTSCGESQAGSWGELCSIISLPMAAEELRYSGE